MARLSCAAYVLQPQGQLARCARELSGAARRTRNRWSCSTRPCAGHRVAFLGFADVPRALGARPAGVFCPPRSRRKASDTSGGESGWFRQVECFPLWPPNLGFLCDSRSNGWFFVQPLLTSRGRHAFETQGTFSRRAAEFAEGRRKRAGWVVFSLPFSAGSAGSAPLREILPCLRLVIRSAPVGSSIRAADLRDPIVRVSAKPLWGCAEVRSVSFGSTPATPRSG